MPVSKQDLHARIARLAESDCFKALQIPCVPFGLDVLRGRHHNGRVDMAWHWAESCPGWKPEPDPERACWLIWQATGLIAKDKGELICAAVKWLEERER